eukprot:TRINITY_DN36061_c0_g1_i1.p1 TRINITY_DN36061_c0_g1~~TRINITY_DN36061_c0_g1_i1.p1  ORF type:complete len:102 (-),score=34.54 TRINITY_DN36061_c0_g1_i1:116-397(-)
MGAVVLLKVREQVGMAPRKAEQVANLRKEVEQLQRELEITRKPLSETIQELIQYTKDNLKDEYLLRKDGKMKGQVEQKDNPFIPPSRLVCDIL